MNRRNPRRTLLAAAAAGALVLSGCGAAGSLDAGVATGLQASVREIAGFAAAGEKEAATARAEELRREVESAAASGTVSDDRAALISARIDAVIASLAAEEPSTAEPSTPPVTTEAPVPVPETAAPVPDPSPAPSAAPVPVPEPAPVPAEQDPEPVEPAEPAPEPAPEEPEEPAEPGNGNGEGEGEDDAGTDELKDEFKDKLKEQIKEEMKKDG